MVLLGVDNAGKTTTLEKLKALFGLKGMPPERQRELDAAIFGVAIGRGRKKALSRIPPTIGFNVGRIQIDKAGKL